MPTRGRAAISNALATLPRAHQAEVFRHTDLATAKKQIFATLGTLEEVAGGVRLHSQTDDLNWLARELARLLFGLEIRRPQGLVAALRVHSRALYIAALDATISVAGRS